MSVVAVVNPALGTTFSHGVTGVYTAIAQVVSIDGPESEVGTRETTNLSSTAKTYAKTLFDGGEPELELELDPKCDSHALLIGLFYGNTQAQNGEQWQMGFQDTVNGPSKATFLGIITGMGPTGIEAEANLLSSFKLKITGTVVWT